MAKPEAVIFDLNKTLRKKNGKPRHHVLKKAKKDEKKESVVVMSGEPSKYREEARDWLDDHGLDNAKLEMRPKGATQHDEKVKEKLLEEKAGRQFKVTKAYDDKPKNVKMFKKHGIKAVKV